MGGFGARSHVVSTGCRLFQDRLGSALWGEAPWFFVSSSCGFGKLSAAIPARLASFSHFVFDVRLSGDLRLPGHFRVWLVVFLFAGGGRLLHRSLV